MLKTLTRLAALSTLSRTAGEGPFATSLPLSPSTALRERGDPAREGWVGEGRS